MNSHRIGSHSDDWGGESDLPCDCDTGKADTPKHCLMCNKGKEHSVCKFTVSTIFQHNLYPAPTQEKPEAFEDILDKAMRNVTEQGYMHSFFIPVIEAHNSEVSKAVVAELEKLKDKQTQLHDETTGVRLQAIGLGHITAVIAKYKEGE